jgi:MFS family permease
VGVPMGGIAALQPVLVSEYFGQSAFGTVYGTLILLLTLAAAAGPVIAGRVYDLGAGYQPTLVACVAASGVAALLMWTARPESVTATSKVTTIES